jgi:hypothetical protein
LFDKNILTGRNYVREEPYDLSVMQEIFAGEQKQNELDGATVVAMTEVYVFLFYGNLVQI